MFQIDVTRVRPLPERHLDLTFEDGLHAVVDMDDIVKTYRGVFLPLLDEDFFRQVRVALELGTIVWPSGADVCPDVLYGLASGQPTIGPR